MIVSKGRPSNKELNLRRFTEQWAEFKDEEAIFDEDDANYVAGVLHIGEGSLDKYQALATELEV